MSQYHPLDVRHPANRQRESKTYLLDPPSGQAQAARTPFRQSTATPSSSAPAATPAAPWGGEAPASQTSRRTVTPPPAPVSAPRRGFRWRNLILPAIVLAIVLSQQPELRQRILRAISDFAGNLGF